ncbi:MAG: hypothetical protein L3J87_01190 [Thermoplasmata archaeon]|nr:hypothetical protein [Thermoplasmata archaeon]MCI4344228.1 hypothetical protein [Thermoplasmata archaeon]
MGMSHLRIDLSLVRQGLSVGWEFGLRSLEDLGSFGEMLQHSVYEAGSFRRVPGGVGFVFRNPPLRMGAFSAVRLFLDGQRHPDACAWVHPAGVARAIGFPEVGVETPLVIPVGQRTHFFLSGTEALRDGAHEIRLELQSVAIPPVVWFSFDDELAPSSERP